MACLHCGGGGCHRCCSTAPVTPGNGKPYEWRVIAGDRKVGDVTEIMRLESGWLFCRRLTSIEGGSAICMEYVPEAK